MLALRPPEYFPRLAYFALLHRADRFVVADTFQYSRQSYQNRTRVASPDGPLWLSVPLAGGQHGTPIHAVRLDDRTRWAARHLKALQFNYGRAPFFEAYVPALEALLLTPHATLGALTAATVECLAGMLHLDVPPRLSALEGPVPGTLAEARQVLGGGPLLALPDTAVHDGAEALAWKETPRHQPFGTGFIPGCSALDALMMYGPAARDFL